MLFNSLLRQPLAGSLAVMAFAATAATAQAADVSISNAKVEAGKLVITGTTAAPNTRVRLDGQTGSAFNVTSNAGKAFKFELVYLPSDCIVTLQKLTLPSGLGAPTNGVVANCGPAGLSARGAWSAGSAYLANDLVTYQGSSWRAKRSTSKAPAAGADWELFAAKGASGQAGAAGAAGAGQAAGDVGALVAPTGPAGGDLSGNYPNPTIRNQAVTTTKLGLQAVTHDRIGINAVHGNNIIANAIKTGRLADNAVTSPKIADATITQADLAANSVGADQIQTDAVQATEIQDNAIDSGEIVDNSLFSADLGSGSVRGSELGTITKRSVVSAVIAAGGNGSASVACLAGERIISGGNDGFFDLFVVASRDNGNGWAVFVRNTSGANRTVTVHAYCLEAS